MNETNILTMIACAAINSPVIRYWGFNLGMPLCLVAINGVRSEQLFRFFGDNCKVMTASTSFKECKKMLKQADCFPVFFCHTGVINADASKRMDLVIEAEKYGQIFGDTFRGIALIVTENAVPQPLYGRVFPIYISSPPEGLCNFRSMVPSANYLPHIKSMVIKNWPAQKQQPRVFFLTAIQFLNFSLLEQDYYRYMDFYETVYEIITSYEDMLDPNSIMNHFINHLFAWANMKGFDWLYSIEEITASIDVNSIMLFSDQYLYLGESIFNDISESLNMTPDILKHLLCCSDPPLLSRQESTSFTSKIPVDPGILDRRTAPRLYRFDLSVINKGRGDVYAIEEGKMLFQEMFKRRNTNA